MRFFFLIGLFFTCLAPISHAQSTDQCAEFSLNPTYRCRMHPDGFTEWSYSTGYGTASDTPTGAAENTMAAYFGVPPGPRVCNMSYSLGPELIDTRDGFILSNQPIIRPSR